MNISAKPRKKFKILAIILAVVLVLLCAALAFAGNFLFNFALNPNASYTMNDLFQAGSVEGVEDETAHQQSEAARAWQAYRLQALEWFSAQSRTLSITSNDGLTLQGHLFPQDGHRYAILYHGYTGQPSDLAGTAMKFYEMGFSVLTPAARGHENSEGSYYGMGWLDRLDLLAWINSVVADDPEAEIFLLGVSMGGATVMMVSGENLPANVKCIIEDCGYSSVWDEFSLQLKNVFGLPSFPLLNAASLVSKIRAGYSFEEASAVEQLKNADLPMLFIHGEADTFVPHSMLNVVYEACASAEKEKLSVPGAAHAQAISTDPELYWATITAFLEKYFEF